MTTGQKYFDGLGKVDAIGFVYGTKKQPNAIKWRPLEKKAFTQDGGASEFWGLDQLNPAAKDVLIVEGEADVIALASIGVKAISCPNGAPMKVSNRRIVAAEDKKFGFVWEAKELLEGADKIIMAIDQDDAGDALVEEIARRVGRAKCWRVQFPEDCNDPNDVIAKHDKKVMLDAIDDAEPMPLVGVYAAKDYASDVMEIYRKGFGHGESTGLSKVDELITIKEGLVYIVTGVPSSGKSEFVDQIMVNLARDKSWKWAVASFENPPPLHIAKFSEKIVGKPFFEGLNPRMNKAEMETAQDFVNDHFVFLESKDGEMSTISSILERTKMAIWRLGVRGLVIDPYNYIQQEDSESEHASINKMLTKVTLFAQAHGIAVFFIAHPAKMYSNQNGEIPIPTGHHISGSAAWFSKADVGFTIHRGSEGVELHVWKMRFKWIGQQGMTTLGYHVPTGRYFDGVPDDQWTPATDNDWDDEGFNF
jgi:twinkle protein